MLMNIELSSIEMDTSIQCRASIDMGVVNEYADRMTEGDKFPPVVLFGSKSKCWIADGWHRIMAAQALSFIDIEADLRTGGRAEALKHALGSNAIHGKQRSNADKRRCVEIALREFSGLTNEVIAEMCAVSPMTIARVDSTSNIVRPEKRIGRDGKQYPATRSKPEPVEVEPERERPVLGPPCVGMQFARIAVMNLEEIRSNDAERQQAFEHVKGWIESHEN